MELFKSSVLARLKCVLGLHRPDRYGARKVDGVWRSHCRDCERAMAKVDGSWRRVRR